MPTRSKLLERGKALQEQSGREAQGWKHWRWPRARATLLFGRGPLDCPPSPSSVQFSSVAAARQAFLSITNSRSLLKLMSIKLDAIQPAHRLLSSSPPTFNLSQHQGLFQGVSFSHQVAKVLEFQLQHQSFQ